MIAITRFNLLAVLGFMLLLTGACKPRPALDVKSLAGNDDTRNMALLFTATTEIYRDDNLKRMGQIFESGHLGFLPTPYHGATKGEILAAISKAASRLESGASLAIYINTHADERGLMLAHDDQGKPVTLQVEELIEAVQGGLDLTRLHNDVDSTLRRLLLILDTCYSGNHTNALRMANADHDVSDQSIVITSTSRNDPSYRIMLTRAIGSAVDKLKSVVEPTVKTFLQTIDDEMKRLGTLNNMVNHPTFQTSGSAVLKDYIWTDDMLKTTEDGERVIYDNDQQYPQGTYRVTCHKMLKDDSTKIKADATSVRRGDQVLLAGSARMCKSGYGRDLATFDYQSCNLLDLIPGESMQFPCVRPTERVAPEVRPPLTRETFRGQPMVCMTTCAMEGYTSGKPIHKAKYFWAEGESSSSIVAALNGDSSIAEGSLFIRAQDICQKAAIDMYSGDRYAIFSRFRIRVNPNSCWSIK